MPSRIPSYRLHKPTGQAVVTLSGRDFYLGKHGTEESHSKYRQILGQWLASNKSPVFGEKSEALTMAQVCLAFLAHAKTYFPKGREFDNYRIACKPVSELYPEHLASKFGPVEFKACRQWWITTPGDRGQRTRQYANKQGKRLKRIIKWAVGEAMMPANNYHMIQCVDPLMAGRTAAPEAAPVLPVSLATIESTLPQASLVVADMVRFQWATGCRPGEVCSIRPNMIDRTGDVWKVQLEHHKTAWRGKQRTIYCTEAAKAILERYLDRPADAYCFSPIEAAEQRRQARNAKRKTPPSCGNVRGSKQTKNPKRPPKACYTTMSYGKAILYACRLANPAPGDSTPDEKKAWEAKHYWSPNQIRHTVATMLRAKHGIDAASTILGHSGLEVTQVYAEADRAKAEAIVKAGW